MILHSVLLFIERYRVGLAVSVTASHTVGFCVRVPAGSYQRPSNCLPALHICVWVECLKGRVLYETVYGDMHLKDPLRSFVRVGYCIPVPVFYLVLHGLRCRKAL